MSKRLLLLSNTAGSQSLVKEFFRKNSILKVTFIPFASIQSWEVYVQKMIQLLDAPELSIQGLYGNQDKDKMKKQILESDAVYVGGGNTFHLLSKLYEYELLDVIRNFVANGGFYVGSSAGTNVSTPNICTTNDMPILQPPSFNALGLINYNINPHYNEFAPDGYHGESRADRLKEYVRFTQKPVLTLEEGVGLNVKNDEHILVSTKTEVISKIYVFDPEEGFKIITASLGENVKPIIDLHM